MIIPVRCFTCGKPVAHLWAEFEKRLARPDADPGEIMTELGLHRYCCRRMVMTHPVELLDILLDHENIVVDPTSKRDPRAATTDVQHTTTTVRPLARRRGGETKEA